MAEVLEKTGKTVEEAYQAALAELGLPESRVSYEVIEEPSKGFLGIIGGKLAKVRVTVRELSPLEKAENFLKEIFSSMHLDVKMEREDKEGAPQRWLITREQPWRGRVTSINHF